MTACTNNVHGYIWDPATNQLLVVGEKGLSSSAPAAAPLRLEMCSFSGQGAAREDLTFGFGQCKSDMAASSVSLPASVTKSLLDTKQGPRATDQWRLEKLPGPDVFLLKYGGAGSKQQCVVAQKGSVPSVNPWAVSMGPCTSNEQLAWRVERQDNFQLSLIHI